MERPCFLLWSDCFLCSLALVHSLDDLEAHFPGQIARVREWFTWYKAVDGEPGNGPLGSNKLEGKEPNVFGFDGACLDAAKALAVVKETHAAWAALVAGAGSKADGLDLTCGDAAARCAARVVAA